MEKILSHVHLSTTFLSFTDREMLFKQTFTLGRHVNNLTGFYHRLATLLRAHSPKTFTRLLAKKPHTAAHKYTTKHTLIQSRSSGTRKVSPLTLCEKLTGGADNKQFFPQHGGNKNRRLRKQIRVMSSKLNGKPCVRKTGESIHIYCCQDFNINIIESTSDVSLSTDWFTKRSTNCHLYLMNMKIQQKG